MDYAGTLGCDAPPLTAAEIGIWLNRFLYVFTRTIVVGAPAKPGGPSPWLGPDVLAAREN